MDYRKTRVLFLCTGNSCRSQMAEALLRAAAGDRIDALSAGSRPAGYVHPKAIEVLEELGLDISSLRSKSINEFLPPQGEPPGMIISVCSAAEQDCPTFPATTERLHWPFEDPAFAEGNDEQKLEVFRRIRDEIRKAIQDRFVRPRLTDPDETK